MRRENGRCYFYQWELDQRIVVPENCTIVHFSNGTQEKALSCDVFEENGVRLAKVPNILLQTAAVLNAYAWDDWSTSVIEHIAFDVFAREKPGDYAYTETEVKYYGLLEEQLKKVSENIEEQKGVLTQILEKLKSVAGIRTDSGSVIFNDHDTNEATTKNSAIFGTKNRATKNTCAIFGNNNTSLGSNAFVGGSYNQVGEGISSAVVFGFHNVANRLHQALFGKWCKRDSKAIFAVGNGTSENNRSNAFQVNADGSAEVAGDFVVKGKDVLGEIGSIETALDSIIAIQNLLTGGDAA